MIHRQSIRDNGPHQFHPYRAIWMLLPMLLSIPALVSSAQPSQVWDSQMADRYLSSTDCSFVDLEKALAAAASAAWVPNPQGDLELVVADPTPHSRALFAVQPSGKRLRYFGSPTIAKSTKDYNPVRLRSADDQIIGQDAAKGVLLDLQDSSLRLEYRNATLRDFETGKILGKVKHLFDFAPMDNHSDARGLAVATFASISLGEDGKGGTHHGFLTMGTATSALDGVPPSVLEGKILDGHLQSEKDDTILFRVKNLPFPKLATTAGRTFAVFLNQEDRVQIGEIQSGESKPVMMESFPSNLAQVSSIIRNKKMEAEGKGPLLATWAIQKYERSQSFAGIYGFAGKLWALTKEPIDSQDHTEWWLHELNIDTGAVEQQFPVPSRAPRLTAVPGHTWAFLELAKTETIGSDGFHFSSSSTGVFVNSDRFPFLRLDSESYCAQPIQRVEKTGFQRLANLIH